MRRVYFVVLIWMSLAAFTTNAFAYQFEDYRWGESRKKLDGTLDRKNKECDTTGKDAIVYHDNILDADCEVTLIFTGITQKLCSTMVIWKTTSVGEPLKEVLVEKYGEPAQPNKYKKQYNWEGKTEFEKISLKYDFIETALIYYGADYYKRLLEEARGYTSTEKQRF